MSKLIPGNHKHLTAEDRIGIELYLNDGKSFKDIARQLCKDPSTISKEVKRNRITDTFHKGSFNNPNNFCIHRYHCKKKNVCDKIIICEGSCRSCMKCNQSCSSFEREHCDRIDKAPYVCNGCPKDKNKCSIPHKYTYSAHIAQSR